MNQSKIKFFLLKNQLLEKMFKSYINYSSIIDSENSLYNELVN